MSSQLQKIPLTGLPILNSTTDLIVSMVYDATLKTASQDYLLVWTFQNTDINAIFKNRLKEKRTSR